MKKLIVVLLAMLMLFGCAQADSAKLDEKFNQAWKNANAGKYELAIAGFAELGDYRNGAEIAYVLGMSAHANQMKRIGDGVFAYNLHYSWGLINLHTCTISAPEWDEIGNLDACGLARVRNGDYSYGLINASGEIVQECVWSQISDFCEGYCTVMGWYGEYLFGIVTPDGLLVAYRWPAIGRSYAEDRWEYKVSPPVFMNDRIVAKNSEGKYAILDRAGRVVGNTYWDEWIDVSQKYPLMKINGLYGYLSLDGGWAIEPQYETAYAFSEGLALVKAENGMYQYINPENEVVIPPVYEEASSFSGGFAHVKRPGKNWDIIDSRGQLVYVITKEMREDYELGLAAMESGQYSLAEAIFAEMIGYKDSYALMLEARERVTPESRRAFDRLKREFDSGMRRFENGQYENAIKEFKQAGNYPGAARKIRESQKKVFDKVLLSITQENYVEAIKTLKYIEDYPPAAEKLPEIQQGIYDQAVEKMLAGNGSEAAVLFDYIIDYKDSKELRNQAVSMASPDGQ